MSRPWSVTIWVAGRPDCVFMNTPGVISPLSSINTTFQNNSRTVYSLKYVNEVYTAQIFSDSAVPYTYHATKVLGTKDIPGNTGAGSTNTAPSSSTATASQNYSSSPHSVV